MLAGGRTIPGALPRRRHRRDAGAGLIVLRERRALR